MKIDQVTTAGYAGEKSNHLYKVALTGLFAALSHVMFTSLQIEITLPGGDTTPIYPENAVCILGALIMGGLYDGLGGAIRMTTGDPFDLVYVVYVPKTFILKLCTGLITGPVVHRIGKINETGDKKRVFCFVVVTSVCGLLFSVIFDPLMGYYYKLLILGKPAAQLALVWDVTTSSVNAITSTIVTVAIYMPLRSILKRVGLFERLRQGLCARQRTGMEQLPQDRGTT